MTQEKLIDAITELDSDILERYFTVKADLAKKKEPQNNAWVKWASLAACFCFTVMIAIIGGRSGSASPLAVINYGPFIFAPVLIVSFIPLFISFIKNDTTLKSSLITSAVSLIAINIPNVLGVYLYSQLGGINIFGNLPIILISSNAGAIISVFTVTLLNRKIKTRWIRLALWVFIALASVVLACTVHNLIYSLCGERIYIS